jgi:hypothetical protein
MRRDIAASFSYTFTGRLLIHAPNLRPVIFFYFLLLVIILDRNEPSETRPAILGT